MDRPSNGSHPTLLLTFSTQNDLAGQFGRLTVQMQEANSAAAAARTKHTELLAEHEQLRQFAYTMAHDLKAPLRRITTLLGFLEEYEHGAKPKPKPAIAAE